MNFPPENSQNYVAQFRNMLQQHHNGMAYAAQQQPPLGGGIIMPAALDGSAFSRASLAKLISGNAGGTSPCLNGTSVIQTAAARETASPVHSRHTAAAAADEAGSEGYDDAATDRRDSTGTNSHVSPGSVLSSAGGNEDESTLRKVTSPAANDHALSPVAEDSSLLGEEEEEMMMRGMSMSPKSEMSDSMDDGEMDGDRRHGLAAVSYNNILHQQLLHRKGSILQYCLTNPHAGAHLDRAGGGGSDAEAEHTSNSPGSSSVRSDGGAGGLGGSGGGQEDAFPGQLLQCEFCDFANSSRFHFNSHMNTHCVHRCPVPECNYSTRTEGRLRRHVKNHHDPSGLKEENDMDMLDEKPRVKKSSDAGSAGGTSGSTGKLKSYRCKQCLDFLATNKNDYYDHQRLHIKPEKLLQCPLDGCRFVTEYKHHLEYHVRNHSGSKPFKCPNSNCNYTCVNKSMLNSHMKSHSSYYQHRCECGYVTKYTHSLKLHLNKYKHKAMNNGPESAQISMAESPQTPPTFHDAPPQQGPKLDPAVKPVKRRRNPNKINVQLQQQQQQQHQQPPQNLISNGGYSPYQMPPGQPMPDGGPMVMAGGFPYGMYGPGPMSQFHAASIYSNMLLSAAAANGMMPGMGMGRFVRTQAATPDRNVKRESPSPSESDPHPDEPQDFSRDLSGRTKQQNGGVLRMLPQQSRGIIRSISELNNNNNGSSGSSCPLDLSGGKENGADRQSESPKSDGSSTGHGAAEVSSSSSRRRRKGPAFKLDLAVRQRLQDTAAVDEEESDLRTIEPASGNPAWQVVQPESPPDVVAFNSPTGKSDSQPGKAVIPRQAQAVLPGNGPVKRDRRELFCGYCSMTFEDKTMYSVHMGFHSQDDPFTCKCGHAARDKVSFFLHIAKAPHF